MYQISLISGRENKRTGPLPFARHFKGKHALGVDIARQAVQHPLMTDGVRVDEGHAEFRTWLKIPFVAIIGEHRPRLGKFFSGPNSHLVFARNTWTAPRELVRVFIHHHPRRIELHAVMMVSMLLRHAAHAGKDAAQDTDNQYRDGSPERPSPGHSPSPLAVFPQKKPH